MSFAPLYKRGTISQKPVAMEQLKQILQLKNEVLLSVRLPVVQASVIVFLKLALVRSESLVHRDGLTSMALADKAYNNDIPDQKSRRASITLCSLPV